MRLLDFPRPSIRFGGVQRSPCCQPSLQRSKPPGKTRIARNTGRSPWTAAGGDRLRANVRSSQSHYRCSAIFNFLYQASQFLILESNNGPGPRKAALPGARRFGNTFEDPNTAWHGDSIFQPAEESSGSGGWTSSGRPGPHVTSCRSHDSSARARPTGRAAGGRFNQRFLMSESG